MCWPAPGLYSQTVQGGYGVEMGPECESEGRQVVCIAGIPDMVQGHSDAAAAYLATGELPMPGVADGESRGDVFPQ